MTPNFSFSLTAEIILRLCQYVVLILAFGTLFKCMTEQTERN